MTLLVKGGPAGSGTKRPKQNRAADWVCLNGHPNRGFCIRCVHAGCNVERPS